MADNDDKRSDDTGAKKTLTLKGGAGLGNRPGGTSRGPSRSTVVVEKRTRVVPKPGGQPGMGGGGRSGAPGGQGGRPQGRPMQQQNRAPLGLSAAEAEARRQALAMAGARQAEDKERFAAEEARRIEEDNRRRQIREEAARAEEERRQAEEARRAEEAAASTRPEPEQPREEFVPASQRNPGPSTVRTVAGRPGQPAGRLTVNVVPVRQVNAAPQGLARPAQVGRVRLVPAWRPSAMCPRPRPARRMAAAPAPVRPSSVPPPRPKSRTPAALRAPSPSVRRAGGQVTILRVAA